MAPLSLGTGSHEVPRDFPALMELLGSRPQPAVVWYGPDGDRVELSGRVLQNWAVKLVGLFREEAELEPGSRVVIDVAPHWKACATILAAGALGCRITLLPRDDGDLDVDVDADLDEEASLVITDRPRFWETAESLGDAELAALSPGLLDDSWADAVGEDLPGWVLDVSADVRQHPDQLLEALPQVPLPESLLPEPAAPQTAAPAAAQRRDLICAGPTDLEAIAARAQEWEAWDAQAWDGSAPAALLRTWALGGTAVVVDAGDTSAEQRWETVVRNEGVR